MDRKIQAAVASVAIIERARGSLCDESTRSAVVFVALRRLAETGEPGVLEGCPDWLLAELAEWVAFYRRTGRFSFISREGEVDHSALMARAAPLLPVRTAPPARL